MKVRERIETRVTTVVKVKVTTNVWERGGGARGVKDSVVTT